MTQEQRLRSRILPLVAANAVLWDKPEQIRAEMERVVPVLKQHGGYIFSSDHSVPSSVSLEDFRQIATLAKELGKYQRGIISVETPATGVTGLRGRAKEHVAQEG